MSRKQRRKVALSNRTMDRKGLLSWVHRKLFFQALEVAVVLSVSGPERTRKVHFVTAWTSHRNADLSLDLSHRFPLVDKASETAVSTVCDKLRKAG